MSTARTHLTPPQVAAQLGVDVSTVRGWLRSGELAGVDLARRGSRRPRFRISHEALKLFLSARSAARPPAPPRRQRMALPPRVYY